MCSSVCTRNMVMSTCLIFLLLCQVESLNSQTAELRGQHEARLQEYAQLLDIKAARIRKLEGQLRDIAYGSRPYKIDTSKFEVSGLVDMCIAAHVHVHAVT